MIHKIHEWMEYAMTIIGVDHFYFYHHIRPQEVNGKMNSSFLWDEVVFPYFREYGPDLITFMKWTQPFTKWFMFQISMMNSCIRLFGAQNRYLMMMDIDEILIPKNAFSMNPMLLSSMKKPSQTVYDVIYELDKKYKENTGDLIGEFRMYCDFGMTCPQQNGDRVVSVALKDVVQCVHMKLGKDVLKMGERIETSDLMQNVNIFMGKVLGESDVLRKLESHNSIQKPVLPYLEERDSTLYFCHHHYGG